MPHTVRRPPLAIAGALLTFVGTVAAFSAPRPARHVLTITATEFAFQSPDTVPAGVTTITLRNRGRQLHHVQLIKLADGHTLGDVLAALRTQGPPPAWEHFVGGPNTPVPGADASGTLDLAPGRYALICFIPGPDGVPHVMKGMAKEITVTAPAHTRVARADREIVPGTTIALTDYTFTISRPLRAGSTRVRLRNDATQPHEMLVVKLAPGRTASDFAAWSEKPDGPPPGAPMGGSSAMAHGVWNDITMTLSPGSYGLVCFVPDARDGKPHAVHGMVRDLVVR
jgi:uncharacterized cupredoxin-like copper-binding protein